MTTQLKNWREKIKHKGHEQELVNRRETIIFNLFNDLTTQESLLIYKDISAIFRHKFESRFKSINEEKVLIESFLE